MSSMRLLGLKCATCGQLFPGDGDHQSLCPKCEPRFGTLECQLNYQLAKKTLRSHPLNTRRDMSMFRYMDLLPVEDPDCHVPLHIGWTPLYNCPRSAQTTEIESVLVKDDGVNPSASYKDRASAMVVARAVELGYDAICTASTGNAAASLAACCRSIHMPCVVFVPATTPQAKLIQMLAYGAHVFRVDGSYDQAFQLACDACEEFGWMNRSAGYNPYLVEGKKTGALELVEQTGFNPPDAVFVSVGDGSIITGLCKGFLECKQLGLTKKVPRVFGIQANGSDVLVRAWEHMASSGECDFVVNANATTMADSICVGEPREGVRALRAVAKVNGAFIGVSDDEIRRAHHDLPIETGVFGEPAAAAAYAGMKAAVSKNLLNQKSTAAVFITGSGLKDLATATRTWQISETVLPPVKDSLSQVKQHLEEHEER